MSQHAHIHTKDSERREYYRGVWGVQIKEVWKLKVKDQETV